METPNPENQHDNARRLCCLGSDGEDYIVILRPAREGETAGTLETEDGRPVTYAFRGMYLLDATHVTLLCLDADPY
jgi:hypothetical protein